MRAHRDWFVVVPDGDQMTEGWPGSQVQRYEIRIRGHLGETLFGAFPGLAAEKRSEDYTVLTGPPLDKAALHGVLVQIETLGLELLEIRRLPDAPGNGGDER